MLDTLSASEAEPVAQTGFEPVFIPPYNLLFWRAVQTLVICALPFRHCAILVYQSKLDWWYTHYKVDYLLSVVSTQRWSAYKNQTPLYNVCSQDRIRTCYLPCGICLMKLQAFNPGGAYNLIMLLWLCCCLSSCHTVRVYHHLFLDPKARTLAHLLTTTSVNEWSRTTFVVRTGFEPVKKDFHQHLLC